MHHKKYEIILTVEPIFLHFLLVLFVHTCQMKERTGKRKVKGEEMIDICYNFTSVNTEIPEPYWKALIFF